jgi:hypothetical protein
MASSSEIMQALRNAHDSGNTKDAARLAQMYTDAKAKETKPSFADQAIDYGKRHGRELATLAGGTVGGLVAAPFAGLASIPTMGLGGVATEAAGVGLGAGIGGQAYDILAQRMGWEKPQTPMQQATNVIKDVAGNAIGVPVGRVASAIATPVVRSVVRPIAQSGGRALANALANPSAGKQLSRAGVQLTPGQMTGGALQRMEDAATSIPVAGDIIKTAQKRGVQTYNRVAIDQALDPLGAKLPTNVDIGRKGISAANKIISKAYDAALGAVTVAPDTQFTTALAAASQTPIRGSLNDDLLTAIDNINKNITGPISGKELKLVDEELGAQIRSAPNSPTGRELQNRLSGLRTELDNLLARTNPDALAGKKAADAAKARLIRVEEASASAGAPGGNFTPAQLASAVKRYEGGPRNAKYARGEALMQNLSEAGSEVLPKTVPDSGTAFRSLMQSPLVALPPAVLTSIPTAVLYNKNTVAVLNKIYSASNPGTKRIALSKLADLATNDKNVRTIYNAVQADLNKDQEQ